MQLPPATVLRVAGEVGDHLGFICGTTGNEGEVWELFDAIVSLSVEVQALRERLASRGSFGSSEAELQRVLRWQHNIDAVNAGFGALIVDASGPVDEVVNQLLADLEVRLGSVG
ncbi:MAG TPA: hypothetical protein VFG33_38810 [Kribbella sp.]|uniref:hypothetical protein n=1 Tax=Kribbella sp. TaxID=1871183 RepID=UPI002D78638D|nr:hypothetical protein [Kribbella sp.]HET6299381.1 hypothetical protein [Kribbella sp.]